METENDLNLDDVLNETAEPEAQPAPEATEAPQEAGSQEGPQRDEQGRFAPKGEKEDAPPASEDKSKGLEAGISAERKKRQETEAQLEQLRQELEQIRASQQPQQPAAPPPSLWDDEQAWQQHFGGEVVSSAVQQATFNAKLDMSEMMARQAHEDFDEIKTEFITLMQQNPALQQQALSDPHPWQKAYQIAKNARTMNELGATNIDELKAQLAEQIKAEQAQAGLPQTNIPKSLAGAQSSRGQNTPAPAALTLEEILGN